MNDIRVEQWWIQVRTKFVLSVLILVQTVCKGYQQTTKVMASKIKVNLLFGCWVILHAFLLSADFFINPLLNLKKLFQEYQQSESVKQFGSRSGQTFCLA